MSHLVYNPWLHQEKALQTAQKIEFSGAREWARAMLVFGIGLLNPEEPTKNHDLTNFEWVDQIALFAWAVSKFGDEDGAPFVLEYWDWHPGNMIVDEQGKLRFVYHYFQFR